jgi:RNA polymerase sigma factor (sigma-70 family)
MLNNTMITAEILRTMKGAVERVLYTSHPSDVADCVQDACVRVMNALDTFDASKGDFAGWCYRIASNVARNWRAASANHGHDSVGFKGQGDERESVDLLDSLVGEDGRNEMARRSEAHALARAIAKLDDDSQMFLAGMAEGMGIGEAGALVGWNAVKSTRRYKEIVATLAKLMAE